MKKNGQAVDTVMPMGLQLIRKCLRVRTECRSTAHTLEEHKTKLGMRQRTCLNSSTEEMEDRRIPGAFWPAKCTERPCGQQSSGRVMRKTQSNRSGREDMDGEKFPTKLVFGQANKQHSCDLGFHSCPQRHRQIQTDTTHTPPAEASKPAHFKWSCVF